MNAIKNQLLASRRTIRPQFRARAASRFLSTSGIRQAQQVRIVEVGPRDGLQNEKQSIPVATKLELIRRLALTGVDCIEAGSFVSPKWVPQMAASNEILESLVTNIPPATRPISYQWLLPNMRGYEDFSSIMSTHRSKRLDAQPAHEVSIFMAATETFSKKNTNCTIAESLERFRPLINAAKEADHPVRAYISVALGCPYEGPDVDPYRVAEIAAELLEMGSDEVSVADTTGMGTAPRTAKLLKTLAEVGIRNEDLALHFHDTFGQALVNTFVSLDHGITTFDSAVAGLGGCPYSPGATGNVATEDLVYALHALGAETGVDLEKMAETGEWISKELGRENGSRAGKATLAQARRARL